LKQILVCMLAGAAMMAPMTAAPGSTGPALDSEAVSAARLLSFGRWFTDAHGRVVMLRGGNVVQLVGDAHRLGPGGGDGRWQDATPGLMAAAGFNAVRLAIFMDRVAPTPGRIDQAYLDAVAATIAAYKRHGIATLIDFHQDEFGPSVGIRGMPKWMTLTDGLKRNPALQFPNGYFKDPAVQRAFDNFWANRSTASGKGVQDAYIEAVAAVARRFRGEAAVFGIDLMNEPATGTPCSRPDPVSADCPELEQKLLAPFYRKAAAAVAAAAPHLILFFEPFMLQGALGIAIDTPIPSIGRSGLSFHNYGPFRPTREKVSEGALAVALRRRAALINTEWGFSNDAADIASQARDFDARLIPWLAWARGPFEGLVNPAVQKDPPANRSLVLRAYARPYPERTAGTPLALTFDADKAVLDYRWSTTGPDGLSRAGLATEIRMPSPSFPRGYDIHVVGGKVISARDAALLGIVANPGASEVRVIATGRAVLAPLAPPRPIARAGLSVDSLLSDLLRDPASKAVLARHLPTLVSSKEIGLAPQISLRSMQPYLPEMSDEVLQQIDRELATLPHRP